MNESDVCWWGLGLLDIDKDVYEDHHHVRRKARSGEFGKVKDHPLMAEIQHTIERDVLGKGDIFHWMKRAPDLCRRAALSCPRSFVQFAGIKDDSLKVPTLKDFHVLTVRTLRMNNRALVLLPYGHGKAVANTQSIVTPRGVRRHGDLKPGDLVFGPDGLPTTVLRVSPECDITMRVTFSDGEAIDCHPRHEWRVFERGRDVWRVMETQAIAKRKYTSAGRPLFQIQYTEPLDPPARTLPVDPYTLGCWLGNGTTNDGSVITNHMNDEYAFPYGLAHSYVLGATKAKRSVYPELKAPLAKLGVIGDKHIPECYLLASRQQRWDLLSGLVDTDGHVANGKVRFVNTNQRLIEGVIRLARSFGCRTHLSVTQPQVSSSGVIGRNPVYTVGFSPRHLGIPARLERKQQPAELSDFRKRHRGIVKIETIPAVPGKCIQVSNTDGLYLVGETMIPTHNSWISSMLVPFMDWAEDYEFTEGRIYYSDRFAKQYARKLMAEVEFNQQIKILWPKIAKPVKPNARNGTRGDPCWQFWGAQGFSIAGKQAVEPSFEPLGVGAGTTGRRYWRTICDDWVNSDNASSEEIQERMWNYYHTGPESMGRVIPDWTSYYGTKVGTTGVVGTLFDRREVNYRLMDEYIRKDRPMYRVDIFPHRHSEERGEVIWPEERPFEWAMEQKDAMGVRHFNMRCRNLIMADGEQRYSEADIDAAIKRGLDYPFGAPPADAYVLIGFDPASGKRTRASKFPAAMVMAFRGDMVHFVEWARWSVAMPRQIDNLADWGHKFTCPVAVEDASQQVAYAHWMHQRHPDIRVITHTTKDNKRNWEQGVESLIPLFEGHKVVIHSQGAPSDLLKALRDELVEWPRGRYTDLVMAAWISRYQYELYRKSQGGKQRHGQVPEFVNRRGLGVTIDLKRLKDQAWGVR